MKHFKQNAGSLPEFRAQNTLGRNAGRSHFHFNELLNRKKPAKVITPTYVSEKSHKNQQNLLFMPVCRIFKKKREA